MAKASKETITGLEIKLNEAAQGLKKVSAKKMFGCHALFADGAVFALVWKEGRIGLKLTDEAVFKKLMAVTGSAPWKAGDRTMSHWILVPKPMEGSKVKLQKWLKTAHELAMIR